MTAPPVRRDADGRPLDDRDVPIEVGSRVRVISVGYGATLDMTSGTAEVIDLGPARAGLRFPHLNSVHRVHYCHLRVA